MLNTLDTILARTLLTVTERKMIANYAVLERQAAAHTPRGFAAGLRAAAEKGPAVIAELKRASPSRGLIREDFRPAVLARALAGVGAAALSVLTDEPFFQGSLAYLTEASQAVTLPILRKDFILDPFQILEGRAAGADAVLLIVAALSQDRLQVLAEEAGRMGLDVLCEVHDEAEAGRAVDLGARIIGVNCRNLKTLEVDPLVHETLVKLLPEDVLRVAESGLRSTEDLERVMALGYDAFLIGETLMRQPDPAAALALLMGVGYAAEV